MKKKEITIDFINLFRVYRPLFVILFVNILQNKSVIISSTIAQRTTKMKLQILLLNPRVNYPPKSNPCGL